MVGWCSGDGRGEGQTSPVDSTALLDASWSFHRRILHVLPPLRSARWHVRRHRQHGEPDRRQHDGRRYNKALYNINLVLTW